MRTTLVIALALLSATLVPTVGATTVCEPRGTICLASWGQGDCQTAGTAQNALTAWGVVPLYVTYAGVATSCSTGPSHSSSSVWALVLHCSLTCAMVQFGWAEAEGGYAYCGAYVGAYAVVAGAGSDLPLCAAGGPPAVPALLP